MLFGGKIRVRLSCWMGQILISLFLGFLLGFLVYDLSRWDGSGPQSSTRPLRTNQTGIPNTHSAPLDRQNYQDTLEKVGNHLLTHPVTSTLPYDINFHILATSEFANAFTMPGGNIYITRGQLELLRTEGELAAVISHEIAHIIMDSSQTTAGGIDTAFSYSTQESSSENSSQLEIRRQTELQADFLGMCILDKTGYDPADMNGMVESFKKDPGKLTRPEESYSTHPDPDTRLQKIQENLEKLDTCPDW